MGVESTVLALGGHTLLSDGGPRTYEGERRAIEAVADSVGPMLEADPSLVVVHGNGPQVGDLMCQQEQVPDVPQLPLDVLVAETQAQLGYPLQAALERVGPAGRRTATVVTRVVVDDDDPAFSDPTKPVGPAYTAEASADLPFETEPFGPGGTKYRRLVPSPAPLEVVEIEAIQALVRAGTTVVCGGGGGIPVVREDGLSGVEAVVDKDSTAATLARDLGARRLVILMDEPNVFLDYGGPDSRPIGRITARDLRTHLENDAFERGTIRPKVAACLEFIESTGGRAIVTAPSKLTEALRNKAGTRVVP